MCKVVVADSSPLRYLLQIDHIFLLPRLFETVTIPALSRKRALSRPYNGRSSLAALYYIQKALD